MNKILFYIIAFISLLFLQHSVAAQNTRILEDFKPVCDSLSKAIQVRTTVKNELMLKNVMKRRHTLDFYFTVSLGDCPWHAEDIKWFRDTLKQILPTQYKKYDIGKIYSQKVPFDNLSVPKLGFGGTPKETKHTGNKPRGMVIVQKEGQMKFSKGLQDRHIALWQSHGRFFDVHSEMWKWQRPSMFNICEDLFTQSFVLPYLVPMLENAGAYVMLPRERDIQTNESIVDNDEPSCDGYAGTIGSYQEYGRWESADTGFVMRATYMDEENPFKMGTARKAASIASDDKKGEARIIWRADIPERGAYAVYVSYKTLPESVSAARYTVHHLGGSDSFIVNQRMGGSTWIYLGTFEFEQGSSGYVELGNRTPKGFKHYPGEVVTADAVRFGGGMGNIARSRKFDTANDTIPHFEPCVSGLPRSMEAARYWLQWAGVPASIYSQNEGANDYKDDFMSRGDWVAWMSGGSAINLKNEGKRIPFDIAFGFHSDAGVTPDSTVIGTLAIYTRKSENKTVFETGDSRMTSREMASLIQSQIVNDLRALHNPEWTRRCIWDRGYRESRTPTCPSMLLELLSHQNFSDMKHGLDPSFRFTASRAIYKGMLKYLSNRYEEEYVVQPLPVRNPAIVFTSDTGSRDLSKIILSWEKTDDPIEPTATATGYIIQTRLDDGAFDNGKIVNDPMFKDGRFHVTMDIIPGHIYSYRITAYNKGGKSFASETVSIGIPKQSNNAKLSKRVLIVNNFDRISGPTFIDTDSYAGFLNQKDNGVPMGYDISFTGAMYDFDRKSEYTSDNNPGFGASYCDNFGKVIAGNTFDYARIHGKALLEAGYPFCSCNKNVFCQDSTLRDSFWTADIICGKQVTTVMPDNSEKFKIFPYEFQDAIRSFTSKGKNLIVSGAYIGTDIWDKVYPAQTDTTYAKSTKEFARKVLGYKHNCNYGSHNGTIRMTAGGALKWTDINGYKHIYNAPNSEFYCIEHPDGIAPAAKCAYTIARYADTGAPAGVAYKGTNYRTVCFGFPLETLKKEEDLNSIIGKCLAFIAE